MVLCLSWSTPSEDRRFPTMTAPRRRWFRFALRTLFVVVTVAARSARLGRLPSSIGFGERHGFLRVEGHTGAEGRLWQSLMPTRAPFDALVCWVETGVIPGLRVWDGTERPRSRTSFSRSEGAGH